MNYICNTKSSVSRFHLLFLFFSSLLFLSSCAFCFSFKPLFKTFLFFYSFLFTDKTNQTVEINDNYFKRNDLLINEMKSVLKSSVQFGLQMLIQLGYNFWGFSFCYFIFISLNISYNLHVELQLIQNVGHLTLN